MEFDDFGNPVQSPIQAAQSVKAYVAGLSLAELETIAIEKLSEALQACNARLEPELAMRLANVTLDRTRGKPAQTVTQTTDITVNVKLSEHRAKARLEAQQALDNLLLIDITPKK